MFWSDSAAAPSFSHSIYTGPPAQQVMTGPVTQPVLHLGTNEAMMLTALTAAMNRLAAAMEGQNALAAPRVGVTKPRE